MVISVTCMHELDDPLKQVFDLLIRGETVDIQKTSVMI